MRLSADALSFHFEFTLAQRSREAAVTTPSRGPGAILARLRSRTGRALLRTTERDLTQLSAHDRRDLGLYADGARPRWVGDRLLLDVTPYWLSACRDDIARRS